MDIEKLRALADETGLWLPPGKDTRVFLQVGAVLEFVRAVEEKTRARCAALCLEVSEQDVKGCNESYADGRAMGATVCMNKIMHQDAIDNDQSPTQ